MNSGLFLRSNGNLVCWDDAGCNHVLQPWDPAIDYGNDVFLGPVHDQIRESMRAGRMPFAACRAGCLALNVDATFDPAPRRLRRISYLQVESSFACQLACPNCYPGVKRAAVLPRTEGGHLQLHPFVLEKILEDFARAEITVELIEFQGHGEPLINPRVWEMVATARRLNPRSNVRIITNANFAFEPHMASSGVSEIYFSIDGVDNESYLPYRVKGDFERAYAFMSAFCREVKAKQLPVHTIWKYVLFAHDDSEEQLRRLAELAEAAQIDELQLIVTQMGDASRRFFSAFLELQTRAAHSERVAALIARLRVSVNAREADSVWREGLGRSPLPEQLVQLRRPKVSLFSYLTLQRDLDRELDDAKGLLRLGSSDEAGDAVSAFAHRLWRLYDGRPEMLIPSHAALIQRALEYIPSLPPAARYQALLKLMVFAPHVPWFGDSAIRSHMQLWAHPIAELQAHADGSYEALGCDPQMILFAENLVLPHGTFTLRVECEDLGDPLQAPRLYVDAGEGFSEELSFPLERAGTSTWTAQVATPGAVRRLRFDPAAAPGRFRLGAITASAC